jgi:putative nucleotidyltransferase with HDIG domain
LAVFLLFVIAGLLLTLATLPPRRSIERLSEFQVNEPAPLTVFAPFSFKVEDRNQTEKVRLAAEEQVPRTYSKIPRVMEEAEKKWLALSQAVDAGRQTPWPNAAEEELTEASREVRRFWTERLTPEDQRLLAERFKDPIWRQATLSTLTRSLQTKEILADDEEVERLRPTGSQSFVSWRLEETDGTVSNRPTGASVLSVTEEIRILARQIAGSETSRVPGEAEMADKVASFFVVPTLIFDAAAFEDDRMVARARVPSVSIEIKQGQNLIRKGETVTDKDYSILLGLNQRTESRMGELLGRGLLVAGILWIIFGYLRRYEKEVLADLPRLGAFLGLITFVVWSGFLVLWGIEAVEGVDTPVGYIVPVAVVGILVTLLENSRLGIFGVLITTFLVGFQFHWDFSVLVVLAITGIVAVYHVMGANLRSQIYLVGLWVLASGCLVGTGVHLVSNPSWEAFSNTLQPFFWGCGYVLLNGFLSVSLSLLVLPLLEDMLGITTEFKLRELSLSHPLLRKLEEVAPGTYYHSLNVSHLAESAAAAIGANALLVKVAAYYHDIGKMEKPAYFAENQFTEEDKKKHSKISPHMSCLIIRNHVKIGLEMARENRLPEALLPFIAEHHGTTLISYFYDIARAEDPHGTVTESDFRYPGPKPQTIESAVLMLADTIEAASRSMNLVGEGEIRLFVKRMINDKMIDEQFDQCPLTFKELHILSESFTRTLKTMMQMRIAYPSTPEFKLGRRATADKNVQPLFPGAPQPEEGKR